MKQFIQIVSLLVLSGCSIVPGMHMSPIESNMRDYRIIPITAESLRVQADRALVSREKLAPGMKLDGGQNYQYRIGPHDVLSVTVWDHPEITIPAGEYRSPEEAGYLVTDDGTIFFPYAGTVNVGGKTVSEVREMLTKGLSYTIENPQVDLKVVSYRSQKAFISGQVVKPGPLPITDVPLTVTEAVGLAGNFTPDADLSHAVLTRHGQSANIDLLALYSKGKMGENVRLKDGDILYIPDRRNMKVYVMGEVTKPAPVQMNIHGLSLTEALGEVGGVNPETSDPQHIFVVRAAGDKAEIYHLDAESPDALVLADQFKLLPMDVVFVEATDSTRYDRTVSKLYTTSQIVRNFGRIVGSQ
ncbi:MAG: polysaccharide export protein [Gammaproteobacteria bacterium]